MDTLFRKVSSGRIITVLGMHRSGTSTVTRGLMALGVGLGDHLHPASTDNPKGFWEDKDCLKINEELLALFGSAYDRLNLRADIPANDPKVLDLQVRAAEILRDNLQQGNGLWGFKDPRTCRLLAFWKPLLSATGSDLAFVICLRNPMSVARSLQKRDAIAFEKSYLLWLQHMLAALQETAEAGPRVVVEYDRLIAQPRYELQRIAQSLTLDFVGSEADTTAYVDEFLEDKLWNNRFSAADLAIDSRSPPAVTLLYSVLSRVAADELSLEGPEVTAAIAEAQAQLAAVRPVLPYIDRLETDLETEKTALSDAVTRVALTSEDASASEARVAALEADLQSERAARDADGAADAKVREELSNAQARIADLERVLQSEQERAADAEDKACLIAAKHEATRSHLARLEASSVWRATAPLRNTMARRPRAARWLRRAAKLAWWIVTLQLVGKLRERRHVRLASEAAAPITLVSSIPTLDDFLASTVERFWYVQQAGLPDSVTQADAVAHFLESGLDEGFSPSPLFPITAGASAMRARLLAAMAEGPAEGWFDAAAYLAHSPDAADSALPPFAHFLCTGLGEGAGFSYIFDQRWYAEAYHQELANRKLPAFLHYLSTASTGLVAPCLALLPIFVHRTETSRIEIERFSLVARAARRWLSRLGPDRFAMLAGLFYSPGYDGGGTLAPSADGPERFAHFLDKGLELGLDPGPLFEVALYQPDVHPAMTRGTALLHFLEHGEAQPAPSTLFNEAEYLKRNLDLPPNNFWLLRHFATDGLFEGRNIDGVPRAPVHPVSDGAVARALMNWRSFWAAHDPDAAQDPAIANLIRTTRRIQTILSSPMFQQSLKAARDLDPAIGDPTAHTIAIPPVNDPREAARVEVLRRLPRLHYDAIICVPWVRNGGADLVGCLLAETVASDPSRTVLLLRVDQPHCDRPDWIPAQVDVAHISDIVKMLAPPQAEDFLYSLLIGLAPRNVFNVNSNLCWRTFGRYGARLARQMELYAYLFCWDHDENGLRVGYPSDFFAKTAPNMTAIFTDTQFLRDELVKIYQPTSAIERKLIPLFSPIRSIPESLPVAAEAAASRVRARPRVLWAGRLDPQKRFDLVIEVAKLLPEIDFECWGGVVLGKSIAWELPVNMQLHGFFSGYDQLGLEDADAWLFTSDWEGMPTLIIELAVRGVSLVASAVGGVPELVTLATGYPVASFSGPEAYAVALRDALGNPQERIARARALQALALSRYTRDSYSTAVEAAICKGR